VLAKFLRAVAKGWAWTHEHPKEAVDLTVDAYPQLDRETEQATIGLVLSLSFDANTKAKGWGWFDPAAIAEQVRIYDSIGQFQGSTPKPEECWSGAILEMTEADRPKLG